jgi:hypothetical protein
MLQQCSLECVVAWLSIAIPGGRVCTCVQLSPGCVTVVMHQAAGHNTSCLASDLPCCTSPVCRSTSMALTQPSTKPRSMYMHLMRSSHVSGEEGRCAIM